MPTLTKITTNVSRKVFDFLERQSRREKTTKRMILERAVVLYSRELNKQELRAGYDAMGSDTAEMTDWLMIANHAKNL